MSASVTDGAMVTFCSSESCADFSWNVSEVDPSMISSPFAQDVLVHALAVKERPVQAAEVAEEVASVRLAQHLRVLLGDDPIEDLQRVVGVAADGVDRGELVLAPLVVSADDDFGHAGRRLAGHHNPPQPPHRK